MPSAVQKLPLTPKLKWNKSYPLTGFFFGSSSCRRCSPHSRSCTCRRTRSSSRHDHRVAHLPLRLPSTQAKFTICTGLAKFNALGCEAACPELCDVKPAETCGCCSYRFGLLHEVARSARQSPHCFPCYEVVACCLLLSFAGFLRCFRLFCDCKVGFLCYKLKCSHDIC